MNISASNQISRIFCKNWKLYQKANASNLDYMFVGRQVEQPLDDSQTEWNSANMSFRLSWSIFVDSLTIAGRSEPSRLSVGRLSDQRECLPAGHGAAHCRQTAPITPVTHCRKLPTLHFFSLAFSDVPQPPTHGSARCLHKVKWSPTAVTCQLYMRFFSLAFSDVPQPPTHG